jgi:hypothetical protein
LDLVHTILAYRQFSVFILIFPPCLAVIVAWMVVRQIKKEKVAGEFCCYMLYLVGAVWIIMWCLPDAWLEEDVGEEGIGVLFWVGTGFICMGLLLHLVLWKLGRLAPLSHRKGLILMLLLAIPGILVWQLLESTGLEAWSRYLVFGGFIFLILLVRRLSVKKRPANRMIRLIKQKQYEQAIALGESLSAEQLSPDVKINLAVSYYFAGEKDKAEPLFEEVVDLPDLPDAFVKVANDWLARLNAESDTTQPQPRT